MGSKPQVERLALNTLFHFGKYSIILREFVVIIVLYVLILIVGLKKKTQQKIWLKLTFG